MNVYYGEIDKAILPTITMLNEKGYVTLACCSGHAESGHCPEVAYIQFEFGGNTPETLPNGWVWVDDGQMEYRYSSTGKDLYREIQDTMRKLQLWCESLEEMS